jgi:hypothetical protein
MKCRYKKADIPIVPHGAVTWRLASVFGFLACAALLGCGGQAAPTWPAVGPATSANTPYGAFSLVTAKELPLRSFKKASINVGPPYMGSSGDYVLTVVKAKSQYLVIVFAPTTAGFSYDEKDFTLALTGTASSTKPSLFTVNYGAAPLKYSHYPFEDAFCDYFNIPVDVPAGLSRRLAVAFDVPAGTGSGTVRIKATSHSVNW